MTAPYNPDDREKVVAKLPPALRKELKVRAAQLGVDIKDAVTEGTHAWLTEESPLPQVDTAGGTSFATYLPAGLYGDLKKRCKKHGISFNQGVAQAIRFWLDAHPKPQRSSMDTGARRLIVGNQKGGVGKTSTSAGLAQALAEAGLRVLLIDFDPQGHLTKQLGLPMLEVDDPSLAKHMLGEVRKGKVRDLLVPMEDLDLGGRLFVLPACKDAFLLDARLATTRNVRIKETALEKALSDLEAEFDYVVVDCPPSLGMSMDTALYYSRTREGEEEGSSGVVIVVLAEDSSADAYDMFVEQVDSLCEDMEIDIDLLGFVVNMYDSRKGFVATSSLDSWKAIGDPPVLAVIPELKEQREAVRLKQALLTYAPESVLADVMRTIARQVSQ